MEKCMILFLSLLGYWNCHLSDGLVDDRNVMNEFKLQGTNKEQIHFGKWQAKIKRSQNLTKNAVKMFSKNNKKWLLNNIYARLNLFKKISRNRIKRSSEYEKYKTHYQQFTDYSFLNKPFEMKESSAKENKSISKKLKASSKKKQKNKKAKTIESGKPARKIKEKRFKIRISRIHRFKKSKIVPWLWPQVEEEEALFEGVAGRTQQWLQHLTSQQPAAALMEFLELPFLTHRTDSTRGAAEELQTNSYLENPSTKQHVRTNNGTLQGKEKGETLSCRLSLKHNIHHVINVKQLFKLQLRKISLAASIIGELIGQESEEQSLQALKTLLATDTSIAASSLLLHRQTYSLSPSGHVFLLSHAGAGQYSSLGRGEPNNRYYGGGDDGHASTKSNGTYGGEEEEEEAKKLNEVELVMDENREDKYLEGEVFWGYLESDCSLKVPRHAGREGAIWTLPYSVALAPSSASRGALRVDLDLTPSEFNQCTPPPNTPFHFHLDHKCPPKTQCQHTQGRGLRRGSYRCLCPRRFQGPPNDNATLATVYLNESNYSDEDKLDNKNTSGKGLRILNDLGGYFESLKRFNVLEKGDDKTRMQHSFPKETTTATSLRPDSSTHLMKDYDVGSSKMNCLLDGSLLEKCFLKKVYQNSFLTQSIFKNSLESNESIPSRTDYQYDLLESIYGENSLQNCSICGTYADKDDCLSYGEASNEAGSPWLKDLSLGVQVFSILGGLTLVVVVARLRRNRVMKAAVWMLLESILIAAILLHSSVFVAYFHPAALACISLLWLRELAFTLLYAPLFLKLQRTLSEFQSRKAHRVQMQDKDLLKALCCMLAILILQMTAWNASLLDSASTHHHLITGQVCQLSVKERLLETGEMIFLAYSMKMCYKVRKAPDEFRQNKLITLCILNEIVFSVIFYSFRYFATTSVHPDVMLAALLLRCHLSASVVVLLEVCVKLWYTNQPPKVEARKERLGSTSTTSKSLRNDVADCRASKQVNNLDCADISNMRPEDIRYELRKLYTQLQIYKTKTMRQDNPHISKRRGGKKLTNRKFSFQNLHFKHKGSYRVSTTPSGSMGGGACVVVDQTEASTATAGGDVSARSLDESSNSMEGVSVYMEENSFIPDVRNNFVPQEKNDKSHEKEVRPCSVNNQ